ncbi:DUF2206 domain-containing protein, partial [Streptomyces sp. B1866]|uniref:DUF2206 domain-containing protein n=1 Tax=Streptomyces sp. B1866 TaxID=3075431 RepID=UPI00288FDF39
ALPPPAPGARTGQRRLLPAGTPALPAGLGVVLACGALTTAVAVAGAVRLNNGRGSSVSVAALVGVGALLALLLARRRRYGAAVLELGLFWAAAALLLLTSLRGWYITGHDIQREFEVFRLTSGTGHWDIAAFRDPYNACLSITLLPTALNRLTGISGIYVFKALMPLLFALTPPLVYRSVRNVAPRIVALLSAVYLMVFPTFFTDMAFLARQEIAFLLLACGMVVLTERDRPAFARRVVFAALMVGVVLSHYSTTYVVTAALVAALLAELAWRLLRRRGTRGRRGRRGPAAARAGGQPESGQPETGSRAGAQPSSRAGGRTGSRARAGAVPPAFVTWWIVVVTAAATALWVGPVTHTTGQLSRTVDQTVQELTGRRHGSSSSDTSYGLVGGGAVSPKQRLAEYRAETVRETAQARAAGDYLPAELVDSYGITAAQKDDLPLTSAGRRLQALGVDVTAANGFVRQSAARLLQLFLFIGLVTTLVGRRRAFRPSRDQVTLSLGMVGVIGLLTVLPQLSVDYGVLRAFQQGLFFFAPFVAAGTLWLCRWAGRKAVPLAAALALLFFADLTGVIPKLLGGYPPQLHLDNAGQYYDIYYVHPEEREAIAWLRQRASEEEQANVQSEIQTDRYTFSRLQTIIRGRAQNDIYPTLIGTDSYVFLGTTTVRKDEATTFFRGDLVTYRYPVRLLDVTKDKVYSSDGAEIYR